jgi:hypothetical protein
VPITNNSSFVVSSQKELKMVPVTALRDIPRDSVLLVNTSRPVDYLDRYQISLPAGADYTTDFLTLQVFESGPAWVDWLLRVRNVMVAPFGLHAGPLPKSRDINGICLSAGDKAGPFTVSHRLDNEIVIEDTDRHLDFRSSVHQCHADSREVLVSVTTAVWYNNSWGRLYFSLIRPFHRFIVASTLSQLPGRLPKKNSAAAPIDAAQCRRLNIATAVALVASLIVTWTGVQHIPMAYAVAHAEPFQVLSASARDFLILLCLCVGLLLIFVGLLSTLLSFRLRSGDPSARRYFLGMTALFSARTAIEVLHPVTVIPSSPPVVVFVACLCLMFLAPAVLAWRQSPEG